MFALLALAAGWLTVPLGISKIRATPAWTLWNIGAAVLAFALLYWICDQWRKTRWAALVHPAGANTLLTYLLPDTWYFLLGALNVTWLERHLDVRMGRRSQKHHVYAGDARPGMGAYAGAGAIAALVFRARRYTPVGILTVRASIDPCMHCVSNRYLVLRRHLSAEEALKCSPLPAGFRNPPPGPMFSSFRPGIRELEAVSWRIQVMGE